MNLSKQNAMQIVTDISEIIHQNINLMDENGTIIASTDPERIGHFHEGASKIIAQNLEELVIHDDAEYEGTRKGINLPIRFDDKVVGVIGMTGKHDEDVKYGQILKKMTEILLLENYSKEQKKLDDRIKARFLDEWLFEDVPLYSHSFIERGLRLGFDVTIPRRVLVAEIAELKKYSDSTEGQRMIDQINKIVRKIMQNQKNGVFTKTASQMICLVPKCSDTQMKGIAETIQKQVQETCGLSVLIGIDAPSKVLHHAYQKAKKALQACVFSKGETVHFYDDINLEIFMDEISQNSKTEFLHRIFRGLDEEEIASWAHLLLVYFNENGSINRTADQLYIHKNTLQYKLRKLREQTGYDPRNLADAALFYLALQFYEQAGEEHHLI